MITSTIFSRAIFSLFFALLPCLVFSTSLILTPDNLQEVLAELSNQHEEEIGISIGEIQQFLEQSIAGNYDANLLPPEPAITEIDEEQIAFAWTGIANANNYLTRYLNLENGDFDEVTTENPGAHFTLENHLFMYTFRTNSAKAGGRVWIIIHDKPLAIYVGPSFISKYCSCVDPLSAVSYSLPPVPQPQVLLTSPYTQPFEEVYSFQFSFTGENVAMVEASFLLKLITTSSAITHAYLYKFDDCSSNFSIDYINDHIKVIDPGSDLVALGDDIEVAQISILQDQTGSWMELEKLNSGYTGFLTLSKCKNNSNDPKLPNDAKKNTGRRSGHVVPNPSSDIVSLYLDQWTDDQQTRFILRNTTGKTLEDFQTVDGPRQVIDLSPYANGTYYLQVISGGQSEVYPIVKME